MIAFARITVLCAALAFTGSAFAQNVKLHYTRKPNVRVVYEDYFIYFSLKDIQDALRRLPQEQQQEFSQTFEIPENAQVTVNVEHGQRADAFVLEPLLKRHVGLYLLSQGMAYIETNKGRRLDELVAGEEGPVTRDLKGYSVFPMSYYDPESNKIVFSGTVATTLK